MLALLFVGGSLFLLGGYFIYGRFLDRKFDIQHDRVMPSKSEYDGVDYVPARTPILFGHHFSSIAGAGPIVGPIIAAMAFGWLPAFIWILVGLTLIGGVHDYTALVASIRHRGRSIGEIARTVVSPTMQKIFLAFIWLTLIYVLVVFLDLTASTFAANGGVATSSILFIVLAILFGLSIYRLKMPPLIGSLIFVPLVFLSVYIGQQVPIEAAHLPAIAGSTTKTWTLILIVYCYIASVTPVWILLQPRDYLSSFLLYGTVVAAGVGLLLGGFELSFAPFLGFDSPIGPMFPILFVTIACGAVSGFHSVIASGTTSKQLAKEPDVRKIGFGAMAAEGVVALIALATVMMLNGGGEVAQAYRAHEMSATQVFAGGMGRFAQVFGVPAKLGAAFGALAISTFLLTTLDTSTRLGRFLFHEFFGIRDVRARFLSALATLVVPAIFVLITFHDGAGHVLPAWKAIWPVFGATNQLLAGLTLLVITIWLRRLGHRGWFVILPMVFMFAVTLTSLVMLIASGGQNTVVESISLALILLSLVMIVLGLRALRLQGELVPATQMNAPGRK